MHWLGRRKELAIHCKMLAVISTNANLQSSGRKSSSEAYSRNEPRLFLKMQKVLSSCVSQKEKLG